MTPLLRSRLAAVLVATCALAGALRGSPLLSWRNMEGKWDPWRDAQILRAMASLSPSNRERVGTLSLRDRAFAGFLEHALPRLPTDARVLLFVPTANPELAGWYRHRTVFAAVPRTVEVWQLGAPIPAHSLLLAWRAAPPPGWRTTFTDGPGAIAEPVP